MNTIMQLQAADLATFAPELTLFIATVVLAISDLFLPASLRRTWIGVGSLLAVVVSATIVWLQLGQGDVTTLLQGSYVVDGMAGLFKLLILTATALTLVMSMGAKRDALDTAHLGEYYTLYLPATIGAMMVASSRELITTFVALELLSITTVVLIGMRQSATRGKEAAYKALVLGGISAAFLLYGMSFLYGMTGTTSYEEMQRFLQTSPVDETQLIYVSFFLIIVGIGFKIAAVPFHAWTLDVYRGATIPVTAFLAVVSKLAGFMMLIRLAGDVLFPIDIVQAAIGTDVRIVLALLAVLSMIVAHTMALRQTNAMRLFALSGIANTGYLLIPLLSPSFHSEGIVIWVYYAYAYVLMNMGAFIALLLVSKPQQHTSDVSDFAGLYYRAPWTAVAVVLLVLSLAGIPLTAGFFGKLLILFGVMTTNMVGVAIVMVVTSVLSFYYYFRIIRQMFLRTTQPDIPLPRQMILTGTLWVCAAASVLLGLFPSRLIAWVTVVSQWGAH